MQTLTSSDNNVIDLKQSVFCIARVVKTQILYYVMAAHDREFLYEHLNEHIHILSKEILNFYMNIFYMSSVYDELTRRITMYN